MIKMLPAGLPCMQADTKGGNTDKATASLSSPAGQPSCEGTLQERPSDFKSPLQPSSAPQEDKEKQLRCGRALLERSMLGPPLPEGDHPICSSGLAPAGFHLVFAAALQ